MVIKGRARGGPVALARHLERRDTNEKISVRELLGVAARDVEGALREMHCMGCGAASARTLYHAAINTAPNERLTEEQKRRAVERLEQELGFEGQPRIVVEHLKKNREHIHVVFLRIDTERMIAIPDSHNYRKHEIAARDLEREFGHQHVQGAHIGREDGQKRPERTPSHDEMQQAERSGIDPRQAKQEVTRLWNRADSGKAFAAALTANGWVLARGDKRDFVLVDRAGEPHSLARWIDGTKAADVRRRMSDMDATHLPNVAEAKAIQRRPSPAVPDNSHQEKVIAVSIPTPRPVKVESAEPPKPVHRAVQTRAERIVDIAKAKANAESASAQRIRETLNLKKTPPANPQPKPGSIRKLYTIAADFTQRTYAKARRLLDGKERPEKPVERKAPPIAAAPPVQPATPSMQKNPTAKHKTVKQIDHPPTKGAILEPRDAPANKPSSAAPANEAQVRSRTRDIKPRLSREELDLMIGRQRQRRKEHKGPSR